MNDDLNSLPLHERARRYRALAHEALDSAEQAASPDTRASFLTVARGWHSLAVHFENKAGVDEAAAVDRVYNRMR